jgi:hypothetical protein
LIDIESSQLVDKHNNLQYFAQVSTLEWAPPEFYSGLNPKEMQIDCSWTSFSYGCMLFQFLFGPHPYGNVSDSEDEWNLPQDLIENRIFVHGKGKNISRISYNETNPHNRYVALPSCTDELKQHFLRCFDSENPKERPTFDEWIKVLEPLADNDCVQLDVVSVDFSNCKIKNYNLMRQNLSYMNFQSSKGFLITECIDIEILVEGEPLYVGKQCHIHWAVEGYESLRLEPFGEKVDLEGAFEITIYETKKFILKGKKKKEFMHSAIDSLTIPVFEYKNPKNIVLSEPKHSHIYPIIVLDTATKNLNSVNLILLNITKFLGESVDLHKPNLQPYETNLLSYEPITLI